MNKYLICWVAVSNKGSKPGDLVVEVESLTQPTLEDIRAGIRNALQKAADDHSNGDSRTIILGVVFQSVCPIDEPMILAATGRVLKQP